MTKVISVKRELLLNAVHFQVLITLFLIFFSITAYAQKEFSPVSPKLLQRLKQSKPDTARVTLLLTIGSDHLQFSNVPKPDLDSAMLYADRAIALSTKLRNDSLINEGYLLKGYTYVRMNDLPSGQAYVIRVAKHYSRLGNKEKEAENWTFLGDLITPDNKLHNGLKVIYYQYADSLYRMQNNKQKSTEMLKRIADVYINAGELNLAEKQLLAVLYNWKLLHYANLHYTYDLLGSVAKLKGNVRDQLYYRIETVKSMENTRDYSHAVEFYGKLAGVYNGLNMLTKAELYYRKAIAAKTSEFYLFFLYNYSIRLAENLFSQKRKGEALEILINIQKTFPPKLINDRITFGHAIGLSYQRLGQLKLAKKIYTSSAKLADSAYKAKLIQPGSYFAYTMNSMDLFISCKDFKSASFYRKQLPYVHPNSIPPADQGRLELLEYKIDSSFKRFEPATAHYKKYVQIKDSIFNIAKIQQIDAIQYKFETEKKDKDLVLRSKSISDLIKQNLLIRNLIIGILAMSLLLLGIGYNRYSLKQKSNLLLQSQRKEIDRQNLSLEDLNRKQQSLLTEKEWLLREIHHRVKNNLQTSMSLLNMQSSHLSNEHALNAIKDTKRRMYAMSLIHQRLYQSENMALIDIDIYIDELVVYLKESFGTPANIQFNLSVLPLKLDVALAVPLGLIINEAITNALKYAFPKLKGLGKISVKLAELDSDEAKLIISDDGIGYDFTMINKESKSLGIKLIKGLVAQIRGELTITGNNGTRIEILFKKTLVPE